jgi:hypothetical protein
MANLKKRTAPLRTVLVKPNSELTGHEFLMRALPTRLYIALRAGDATEEMMLAETLAAIIDSTLDCEPADLAPDQLTGLTNAWSEAWKDAALPPVTGRRSVKRSPSQP